MTRWTALPWSVLRSYGVPQQLVEIIEVLHAGTWCHVRTTHGTSQDFGVKTGVRQGCVLSPILFNCFMDRILKEVAGTLGRGLQVEYTTAGGLFLTYRDKTEAATLIQAVLYADDLTLIADLEMKSLSQLWPQWVHQDVSIQNLSNVDSTVWSRDLTSDKERH